MPVFSHFLRNLPRLLNQQAKDINTDYNIKGYSFSWLGCLLNEDASRKACIFFMGLMENHRISNRPIHTEFHSNSI